MKNARVTECLYTDLISHPKETFVSPGFFTCNLSLSIAFPHPTPPPQNKKPEVMETLFYEVKKIRKLKVWGGGGEDAFLNFFLHQGLGIHCVHKSFITDKI